MSFILFNHGLGIYEKAIRAAKAIKNIVLISLNLES